jgi:hypothetical protein
MRLREYFYDSEKENNDNEANKEWWDKKKVTVVSLPMVEEIIVWMLT